MQYREVIALALLVFCHFVLLRAHEISQDETVKDVQLVIDLPNGKIRGKCNGYFYSYESIPYAQPPVGDLRFESPLPYTARWDGVRDATQKPVPCMQWDQFKPDEGDNKLHGAEDCLTVNVYKPIGTQNNSLSVLIFIHGGAFMFGSSEGYDEELIMRHQGFVVVKMNYRLGPLGFLSTEDSVIPGNYGLKDQRLALQWIKSNIARFGGDPKRMVVAGFSAGGASVHLHMLQKDFTEYAKAAASFSGTAFNPWVLQRNSRSRALKLAKNLKCINVNTSAEIKRCLKSKAAHEIVRGVRSFLVFGYNPFTTFGPVVEPVDVRDAFLTQTPEDIVRSGEFAQLPWLVSYTAQDGGYNAAELLQVLPRRREMIESLNERWFDVAPYALFFKDAMTTIEELDDHSMSLKNDYLHDKEFSVESYSDVQRMYTDVLFKKGVEKAVRLHRKFSKSPIYAYVYDNPPLESVATVLAKRKDIQFGTTHGDDVYLIFRNPLGLPTLTETFANMSNNFIQMLEDFVLKSDGLKFGDCTFVDNVNQENLQLLWIMQDKCKTLSVNDFPET